MLSSTLRSKIRSSFWTIPSIYALIAVVLSFVSVAIDPYILSHQKIYNMIPSILFIDIELARTILSSISASLLTMTTITFSTILVVLTTFLSEFSPRTLQNFITNPSTQRVLGIFVGGFIYSILLLLLLKPTEQLSLFFVPSLAVFLAIICLMVFVFFIHHTSNWIQVSNLIHNISISATQKIDEQLSNEDEVHEDAPWEDWESEEIKNKPVHKIFSHKTGYIRKINIQGLIKQAAKDDVIIRVERQMGEYVNFETTLLSIWKLNHQHSKIHYEKYISIGKKKAPIDDIEFDLTKLVEIALRSLSPGINDPYTAINCIDNLGRILDKLGKKYLPKAYHHDKNRNLRVLWDRPDFRYYLYKCFYQITYHGFKDISVLLAITKSLTIIAHNNSTRRKEVIWELTEYIIEGINRETLLSLDRKYLNEQLVSLATATGHNKRFKPFS
ncbi:DUF2254 domain-containing protein [Salipaludibacillus daqingensis]|uniref:DUF2254 domain-containing protein n=1 Tax=Salipaludibacillus daqingensis TaxID=3041001 RepID=UPI002473EDE0|nr:DUF2254 domain-containing protein [Salipaludibacillus daqingensis]